MSAALKRQIVELTQRSFVRNVAKVASGAAAAQAITMGIAPIVTRIYGPEAFGALGVFSAILSISGPAIALSYPVAIVLPGRDRDAAKLILLSLSIAAFASAFVLLVILLSGDALARFLRIDVVGPFLVLLPLAMLGTAFMDCAQQWIIRKKLFGANARVEVVQSFLVNGAKAGIGFFHPVAGVLISIAALAPALLAAMLAVVSRRAGLGSAIALGDIADVSANLKAVARKFDAFPRYRMPQGMLNAISQSLPVILLARFDSAVAAGFYVLAMQVLVIPITLVGRSVGLVFYPRIVEAARSGENLTRILRSTTLGMVVIGSVPFALIVLAGPWLFTFVFGGQWTDSGRYAQWLAIWLFFGFINRPSVAAIPVLGMERFFLLYEVFSVSGRIVALWLGFAHFADAEWAIMLFASVGAAGNIVLIGCVAFNASRRSRHL